MAMASVPPRRYGCRVAQRRAARHEGPSAPRLEAAEQLARRDESHAGLQAAGLAQESDIPADEIVRAGVDGGGEHRRAGAVHTRGESLYLIAGGIGHDLWGHVEKEFAKR